MDQRNVLLAVILSTMILSAFWMYEYFVIAPQREQARPTQQTAEMQTGEATPVPVPGDGGAVSTPGAPSAEAAAAVGREKALDESPRVHIESDTLRGSISLEGGRVDDLVLKQYRETLDPNSPDIELLRPVGGVRPYFANFGWTGAPEGVEIPTAKTVWEADRDTLSPGETVTLTWDNGKGLRFERSFSLDTFYMFEVTQRVVNESGEEVTLSPYGLVSRTGTPEILGFYILHEGLIGVFDETLNEIDYSDLVDDGPEQFLTTGGWLGITDKYWLVALVPDQKSQFTGRFLHEYRNEQDKYQADYIYQPVKIPAGAIAEITNHFFAGAKKAQLLDGYREEFGIPHFDRAIDFGWFWFLTKPFFYALIWLQEKLGNFGLSILALTVLIKLAFFPLANKSYKAMAKMRKLQPEMIKLRERFGEDKQRLNQEMMALYKKEGANPMSGCLPIVVQIPVFFALYKVLFVSIEMRQAPFYGWIKDLSVPDPTSILNGFGLLPWDVPELGILNVISIGIWPLAMGISMWMQQQLNPQPTDPVQAKIFLFMPIVFTFLLAHFPAGLVIYWTWNNVLSIGQQYVIMRRAGVPIGRNPKPKSS